MKCAYMFFIFACFHFKIISELFLCFLAVRQKMHLCDMFNDFPDAMGKVPLCPHLGSCHSQQKKHESTRDRAVKE